MFCLSSKILNEMIEKRKTRGDKRGLDYLSKSKTPQSRNTTFLRPKVNSSFRKSSPKQATKCTICNKFGHVASRRFNSLKNINLMLQRIPVNQLLIYGILLDCRRFQEIRFLFVLTISICTYLSYFICIFKLTLFCIRLYKWKYSTPQCVVVL